MTASIDALLAAVPEEKRDKLFKLLDGSSVVEQLTGERPHRSVLHRWASKGIAGVRLQTVTVGRTRYTTRRRLLEFFSAVDTARSAAAEQKPSARPTSRSRTPTSTDDEDVLLGVRLIEAEDGRDLTDGDASNPTAKLIRHVLEAVAEFDKDALVLKLRAARVRRRRAGFRVEGPKPYPIEIVALVRKLHRRLYRGAPWSFARIAALSPPKAYRRVSVDPGGPRASVTY